MSLKMNLRGKIYSQVAKARNACLQNKDQEGFRVRFINDYIGNGVFCEKNFAKGDFLLEYRGELISGSEGAERDKNYPDSKGSFFFFFQHGGKSKCVDGTASDGRGRMVNDSHKNANCKMKVVLVQDIPKLCLFAIKDLKKGDELRCDYGVKDLPWRKDESNTSVSSDDPPSDSESCDIPCGVSNHRKRQKKSQSSTEMEGSAHHHPKIEVIIKVEPPEQIPDSFDSNIDSGVGPPSSHKSASSTFDQTEMASSNFIYTDQPGAGNADAEYDTSIPDPVDLQSFIRSHTVESEEDRFLKSCSISVPFIHFESSPNLNLTVSGQSNEEEGYNEASYASSDSECYGDNGDETHLTVGLPRMDPISSSNVDVVPKTAPEDNVSNSLGSSDVGDLNIVHQDDPSTEVTSEPVSAPVDTCNNALPHGPPRLKKPSRKCPFCLKTREKLTRHIKHMHKDLRRVQEAMMLPEKEQVLAFGLMRKEGILIANMQRMKETNNPVFERERRSQVKDPPLVICSTCKGFYSEAFYARHKCEVRNQGDSRPIPVSAIESGSPENNDASADPPSDSESCGMCCEEEVPHPGGDDLFSEEEHTLVGSDDLLICFEEGHMQDSSDDVCSEEGYTSVSSDDWSSDEGDSDAGSNDLHFEEGHTHMRSNDLPSEEGHNQARSDNLIHSEEGHTHAGSNDLHSEEGHTQARSNDLIQSEEGNTHEGRNDLPSKEGHIQARSDDLIHSEEGKTHEGGNDLLSEEGHTHAGNNDSHSEEGHTHAGSNDLPSKEGHTQARSDDLIHSEEGKTHEGGNDLLSEEGHTHAGSNDLHSKEGHTYVSDDLDSVEVHTQAGSNKSKLQKAPLNESYKNMQEAYAEPEANVLHDLSEHCDTRESGTVTKAVTDETPTQDSCQSGSTSVETSNKKLSKSWVIHSKHKRPHRKCPFCLEFIKGHLREHISSAHADMRQVQDALKLPEKERKVAFALMKKSGVFLAKKEKMNQSNPVLEREHRARTEGSLVMCGRCKGVYSYRSFWRHKISCRRDVSSKACSGPVSLETSELESRSGTMEFKQEILDHLPTNEIGDLCRSEPTLLLLGERWWEERMKVNLSSCQYIRKVVMSDMKQLATLFKHFKELEKTDGCGVLGQARVRDMFDEQNFESLCEAVNTYTKDVESLAVKVKLKSSLFVLLKKACKAIKASCVTEGKYDACVEMDRFMAFLAQNSDCVFGVAGNQVMSSSCSSLTDLADLSMEDDVRKLRTHILDVMTSMLKDTSLVWNADTFKKLRDLTVLRLTMLNARRGGKPCRLTSQEFQEGVQNTLTGSQGVGSTTVLLEKGSLENWTTVYQTSFGNSQLVPVSIPADCLPAMVILSSRDNRELAGVPANNPYMFAHMEGLEHYVSGWNVLSDVCNEAEIDKEAKSRAAENYQWVSLLYASMELLDSSSSIEPDGNRSYKEMGLTFEVNDAPVVQEIEEMTVEPPQVRIGRKRKQLDEHQEELLLQTKRKPPETSEPLSADGKVRPARLCPFCLRTVAGSQLSRHIRNVHKDLDDVKYALRQPYLIRNRYFAQMKKLGLYKLNVQRVLKGSKSLLKLRSSQISSPAAICKSCKCTYSKRNFRKHKCGPVDMEESAEEDSVSQSFLKMQQEDPYFANIVLSTIMHSKVGKACIMDKDILTVGRWIWNIKKGRTQGSKQAKPEVLKIMRHLTVIKLHCQEEMLKIGKEIGSFSISDMFCGKNVDSIKMAVWSVAAKTGESVKDQVKHELFASIKKAAAVLVAFLLIHDKHEKSKEIEQFLAVFDERKNSIVGNSEGQVDVNKRVGNENCDEQQPSEDIANQCSDKREHSNKEVDHISHILESYFKAPRRKGNMDLSTGNKDAAAGGSGTEARAKRMNAQKNSKFHSKDWATIEDSESDDEEAGRKNVDNEFSLRDEKSREGKGKKQKWSEHATNLINEHFKSYICTAGDINRGKLPGKEEIKDFLKENREVLHEVKSVDRKILLVKTKVFNERNNYRRNLLAKDSNVD